MSKTVAEGMHPRSPPAERQASTIFGRFLAKDRSPAATETTGLVSDEIEATLKQHREELDKLSAANEKLKASTKKAFDKVRAELDQAR